MNDQTLIPVSTYEKANSFHDVFFSKINADYFEQVSKALKILNRVDATEVGIEFVDPEYLQKVIGFLGRDEKFTQFVLDEASKFDGIDLIRYWCFRYLYDVYPAIQRVAPVPPCVQVEPTSICNFRCTFCYQTDNSFSEKKSGHMGTMDLDLFRKIIDQIEGHVGFLTLASRGEPTVAKQLPEMLDYCRGKFSVLKVNTNASLLTEKINEALMDAADLIVISADAADPALYSKLRVGGKLDKIIDNVKKFSEVKYKHQRNNEVITRVSGVFVDSGQSIEALTSLWEEMVDQVAFVKYNPWENIYLNSPNKLTKPCSDLWRRLFIWFDGSVNPCDTDYKSKLRLGNVGDESVIAWWHHPSFDDLRNRHKAGNRQSLEPCCGCFVT